jgi:hypothetical protein
MMTVRCQQRCNTQSEPIAFSYNYLLTWISFRQFDSFSLDPLSITSDHPSINILASHVDVALSNDHSITVMLIQKPVSRQEIQDWIDAKEQGIIIATSPSSQSEDDINSERLSPRIIEQIQRYVVHFSRFFTDIY